LSSSTATTQEEGRGNGRKGEEEKKREEGRGRKGEEEREYRLKD